jgi:predicted PurR-regulated permease PerM
MSPHTPDYPGDPAELLTYLEAARADRKRISRRGKVTTVVAVLAGLVALLALAVAFSVIITQHNNLIQGCHRAHDRDRELAGIALSTGALETRERALERADTDCAAQYPLLP